MDKKQFSRPLDLKEVRVTDSFWPSVQETVRTKVIPYQWEALNDRVPGAEPSYCMHNFRAAGRMLLEKRAKGAAYTAPGYTFRGFRTLMEDTSDPDPDKFYGKEVMILEAPGLREEAADSSLYDDYVPAKTHPATLKFIPYYAWANRGEGEMQVWVRIATGRDVR